MRKLYVVKILSLCVLLTAWDAMAQQKLFAVSGQGRGSPADAKQAAQISALESENQDRLAETNQNSADIADHETRLNNVETTCTADKKLRWDGSSWNCIDETDPTVGAHGRSPAPPDCHDTNAKLLWDGSANQWHCEPDITLSTPPTCSGGSRALQWNGSSWSCKQLTISSYLVTCSAKSQSVGCNAVCPSGTTVTGGGFSFATSFSDAGITSMRSGNGWYCNRNRQKCSSGSLSTGCRDKCYAICSSLN